MKKLNLAAVVLLFVVGVAHGQAPQAPIDGVDARSNPA